MLMKKLCIISEEELTEKNKSLMELEELRNKIWNAVVENYQQKKSDHDTVIYIRERLLDWQFNECTE